MTTEEILEEKSDAVISDLHDFWGVQVDEESDRRYLNVPLPGKNEFINRFEAAIDDLANEKEQKLIDKFKKEISEVYEFIVDVRDKFEDRLEY